MRIVDAFWEKRNLGVSCYELHMELSDLVEEVENSLNDLEDKQYMVAKIPSSRYDLVQMYQKRGYTFIETAISLEYNYKRMNYKLPEMPRSMQRICDKVAYEIMGSADLTQMKDEINKNIFRTDRIYVDPAFTHEDAARRYIFWIEDLAQQGNMPYKVMLDNKVIGFFVDKEIAPKICNTVLGGVYSDYANAGVGYGLEYAVNMSELERGMERSFTSVSGTNPSVLRLHLAFGASVTGLTYVLVKHNG